MLSTKFFFSFSRRAVTFRRLLADAKHDLESLQKLWEEGKRDAMTEQIKKLDELKEEEQIELVDILDHYFDPEKKAVKPIVQRREGNRDGGREERRDNGQRDRQQPRRRRVQRGRSVNKENQGPRPDSRRRKRSENGGNNKRMNNIEAKSGAGRKDNQLDANQNIMVSAN